MDGEAKSRVRRILALALLPASLAVGMTGLAGWLSIGWAVVLAVTGLGMAAMLPTGGRAAGWLFALWCGVALTSLGRMAVDGSGDGPERLKYALIGGLVFLMLAATGFWACTPARDEED
jgi:hypothetical protein